MDQLWPGGEPLPVRASLRWRATDPYAVQLSFHTRAAADVVWVLSRESLAEGPTGGEGGGGG